MPEGKTDFFKLDRKIFESDIWLQPVELRLFIYLIGQARHSEKPYTKYKSKGVIIKRGQYLKSYRKLREELEYFKNNAIKNYSLSRIKTAIDRLEKQKRIKTEKTQLGTLFTVLNYEEYQGSYEKNDETENEEKTESERSLNGPRTESERTENNTKNVKNVNKEKKDNKKEDKPSVPYQKIKDLYNQICGEILPSIRTVSDRRRKHLRARWKEEGNLQVFEELFQKTINNDFLTGDNDRGWKADFDWLIKNQTNFNKVLEGKYDSGSKKSKQNEQDERLARIYQKYKDEEESVDVL